MADRENLCIDETKEVLNFLNQKFTLYGLPEKSKRIKVERLYRKNMKNFANHETLKLNIAHRDYIPAPTR